MEELDAEHGALRALRRKYAAIISLRRSSDESAPRLALRQLAHEFPGALRELDQRSMSDLEDRLLALDAALAGRASRPDWVLPQHAFHGFLRAALRLRPRLRSLAANSADSLSDYSPSGGEPAGAQLTEAWLSLIRRPPGGRLSPLAHQFVAHALGLGVTEVEALLDPRSQASEL